MLSRIARRQAVRPSLPARWLVITGLAAFATVPAHAQVVWDRSGALPVEQEATLGGPGLSVGNGSYVASQFQLTGLQTLGAVSFWGRESLDWAGPSTFDWWIYAADGPEEGLGAPRPQTVLGHGSVSLTRVFLEALGGYTRYRYDFALGSLALTGGTYFLAMNARSPLDDGEFLWEFGEALNDTHVYRSTTGSYADLNALHMTTMRYRIETRATVTPEPTAVILLGLGLAGLAGASRRRRREARLGSAARDG